MEVLEIYELQAKSKNLEFVIFFNPKIPDEMETDKVRMQQILSNIVSNSLRNTEKGSIQVDVIYQSRAGILMLQVVDTGRGIAERNKDTLFDEFSQKSKGGSTGQGLFIS